MISRPFQPTKWTLLFLLLSAMMILMGGAAVAPALPLISESFPDSPESLISLIITLPALVIALTGFLSVLSLIKLGKLKFSSDRLLFSHSPGYQDFFSLLSMRY